MTALHLLGVPVTPLVQRLAGKHVDAPVLEHAVEPGGR